MGSRPVGRFGASRRLSLRSRGQQEGGGDRAESRMRESGSRFHSLFDRVPIGLYRTTIDGRVLDANPALVDMLGYPDRESLLAEDVLNLYVKPDDRVFWRRRVEHDEVARNVELQLRRRDGRRIWVRDTGRVVRDRDGGILYYEGSIEDITGAREARQRFRQIFARFRELEEIINRSPVVVFRWLPDRQTAMQFVSGSVRRFGYVPEEFTSGRRHWLDLVHPEDSFHLDSELKEHVGGGRGAVTLVFRWRNRDGEYRWIEENVYVVRQSDGSVAHLEGIMLDITRRRELERQLLEITGREQQRIGRDLHDVLGQNLTGISFMVASLVDKCGKECPSMHQSMKRIGELVNQAIAQTRMLARGLCPVELEIYGLRHGLSELAHRTRELTGVNCSLDCSEDFFQKDDLLASNLYHICREAVNNAVKHGPPQNLQIHLARRDELLELTVSDDGPGFSVEERKQQSIGLTLMQYRAESVGGSLQVKSVPGKGTRVEFRAREQQRPRQADFEGGADEFRRN